MLDSYWASEAIRRVSEAARKVLKAAKMCLTLMAAGGPEEGDGEKEPFIELPARQTTI